MDASKPLTQIGKYEILSELGRGGMGIVYRAEDKFIGREVAIKTLTETTPELRQRFLVEARSGVLNHQNIVTLYDFGEQDGNPYIVMEFLRGESLERLLKEGRVIPLVEKLEIIRQTCEGLGYAHNRGVVHRDIKPANIMVQPDGHVKIVDFGIARLESVSGHTVTGAVIGTFHYIAPERLKGEPSDGRADIWAAGVILYLLVTGQLPFPGDNISSLHKVVNESFEPLTSVIGTYPAGLDAVIDRALAKNPEDRYGSAEEMAADIEAISETLKRARVGEVLEQVKSLLEQEDLSRARPMLLDLQRLAPQNTEVKRLLRDVQDRLSRQQRSEQVRQLMAQAEESVHARRYAEALDTLRQASRVDPGNRELSDRVEQLRALRERVDKVEALKTQAQESRHRREFGAASELIQQAIELDSANTDLRNEQARILQEQERESRDGSVRRLQEAGRNSLGSRQFTDAITALREALQLDPTDADTQRLYQEAVARQEEDRRRKIIEQIVSEIQGQIARGNLDRAVDLTNRALERLPGESSLLRLKAETQARITEAAAQRLVEETSLQVQTLLFTAPEEALAAVTAALEKMPGEERLLALQARVAEHLWQTNLQALRAQYLQRGQVALDAQNYAEAINILEAGLLECQSSPELESLLEFARSEKATRDRRAKAATALAEAQELIGKGDLQAAVAVLQRTAEQTQDGAIAQLLRQTQERAEEAARRVQAVRARIVALGEESPEQALRLLGEQPESVQQHTDMRSLRTTLEARVEQEHATAEAVQRADKELAEGKLQEGRETLETVRRAFGSFPAIEAALAAYTARLAPAANGILQTSIAAARQLLLTQQPAKAVETLRSSSSVVPFANAAVATDWKRLADEAAKAAGLKTGLLETPAAPVAPASKLNVKVLGAIAAVLLLAVLGAAFFLRGSNAAPVSKTFMELNASPFAQVLSITPAEGSALKLPEGDHATPMRLDNVPEGKYAVVFKSITGASVPASCTISEQEHLCTADISTLSDADVDAIVQGAKP